MQNRCQNYVNEINDKVLGTDRKPLFKNLQVAFCGPETDGNTRIVLPQNNDRTEYKFNIVYPENQRGEHETYKSTPPLNLYRVYSNGKPIFHTAFHAFAKDFKISLNDLLIDHLPKCIWKDWKEEWKLEELKGHYLDNLAQIKDEKEKTKALDQFLQACAKRPEGKPDDDLNYFSKINLDGPKKLQIRHLLTHHSGFKNPYDYYKLNYLHWRADDPDLGILEKERDEGISEENGGMPIWDYMKRLGTFPLQTKPGKYYTYANANIDMLALVVIYKYAVSNGYAGMVEKLWSKTYKIPTQETPDKWGYMSEADEHNMRVLLDFFYNTFRETYIHGVMGLKNTFFQYPRDIDGNLENGPYKIVELYNIYTNTREKTQELRTSDVYGIPHYKKRSIWYVNCPAPSFSMLTNPYDLVQYTKYLNEKYMQCGGDVGKQDSLFYQPFSDCYYQGYRATVGGFYIANETTKAHTIKPDKLAIEVDTNDDKYKRYKDVRCMNDTEILSKKVKYHTVCFAGLAGTVFMAHLDADCRKFRAVALGTTTNGRKSDTHFARYAVAAKMLYGDDNVLTRTTACCACCGVPL